MMYDYIAEYAVVAQERSITKAARRLSVSPSTLSRHMTSLEHDLGVILLERTTHGMLLTPQGEYLLERASEMVSLGEQTRQHFAQVSKRCLTISGTLEDANLAKAIKIVAKTNAELLPIGSVRFVPDDDMSSIIEQLDKHAVDLYFTFATDERLAALDHRHESIPVIEHDLYMGMKNGHPLSSRQEIVLSDIAPYLITRHSFNSIHADLAWNAFVGLCSGKGFSPKPKLMLLNSIADLLSMDIEDCLTPIMGETPLKPFFADGNHVLVPVADTKFVPIVAAFRKGDAAVGSLVKGLLDNFS